MMAEAAHDKKLNKHHLVYEEPEAAMHFPIADMFGEKTEDRLEFIPDKTGKGKNIIKARTVQDWHDDLIKHELPFIWVTDSFDALTSEDELKSKDTPKKGGWKTEKPIVASATFPKIVQRIEGSASVYMWISQTRDKMGVTFGNPKTYAGGNAIDFYRSYENWLAHAGKIKRKVRGIDRDVGDWVVIKINKNKFTGKRRQISFPIYEGKGIGDVESMVQWMVDEKFWGTGKGEGQGSPKIVKTEEPFIDGRLLEVVKHIEDNNLEEKLKEIVQESWGVLQEEIEEAIAFKSRYTNQ